MECRLRSALFHREPLAGHAANHAGEGWDLLSKSQEEKQVTT